MTTTQTAATVTLAGQTFTTEVHRSEVSPSCDTVYLTGKRGGVYFLRGFLGEQTGYYEVISWKSGAPLRDKCQRPVRVHWLGDIIEQA